MKLGKRPAKEVYISDEFYVRLPSQEVAPLRLELPNQAHSRGKVPLSLSSEKSAMDPLGR